MGAWDCNLAAGFPCASVHLLPRRWSGGEDKIYGVYSRKAKLDGCELFSVSCLVMLRAVWLVAGEPWCSAGDIQEVFQQE